MQNHNVYKKDSITRRDYENNLITLDNLIDTLGVVVNYYFWDGSEFVNKDLQCYIIPVGESDEAIVKTKNSLTLITMEKEFKRLFGTESNYREPVRSDTFKLSGVSYNVVDPVEINLYELFDSTVVPVLLLFTGVAKTIRQATSLA